MIYVFINFDYHLLPWQPVCYAIGQPTLPYRVFPNGEDGASPPHQPKICSSPHLEKTSPVDSPSTKFLYLPPLPKVNSSHPTSLNKNFQVITQ